MFDGKKPNDWFYYKPTFDSKNKFSRDMKKYHQISTYQTNSQVYYIGFIRHSYGDEIEEE